MIAARSLLPPPVRVGADDGGAIGRLHFRCRDRGLGLQPENLASEFWRGRVTPLPFLLRGAAMAAIMQLLTTGMMVASSRVLECFICVSTQSTENSAAL